MSKKKIGESVTPYCMKCGSSDFSYTCLTTYKEDYEVVFDEDGGFDRQLRTDYDKYWEEERSAYRCSKCGWIIADDQGAPLQKADDLKQWAASYQKYELESDDDVGGA
jgi:hypothetical protein